MTVSSLVGTTISGEKLFELWANQVVEIDPVFFDIGKINFKTSRVRCAKNNKRFIKYDKSLHVTSVGFPKWSKISKVEVLRYDEVSHMLTINIDCVDCSFCENCLDCVSCTYCYRAEKCNRCVGVANVRYNSYIKALYEKKPETYFKEKMETFHCECCQNQNGHLANGQLETFE